MVTANQSLDSGGKKPTTPTIGTATGDFSAGTVSVAFTPSTYIGKGTVTYEVLSSTSVTGTGSGSPITVSGLTAGVAATFRVRALTNSGVYSDYSSASNSVTPGVKPGTPTIGTASNDSATGNASITFTAGSVGSGGVTYTATSSPGGITGTSSSSPITVSGLTAGTAYTFTVSASNAYGTSSSSGASNSVTVGLKPGAPTIGTATNVNTT